MRYAEILWAGFLIILIGAVILTVLPSRLGFGEISPEILYPLMIGITIFAGILMLIWTWRTFLKKKE
jgi:hypothetical protein